MFTVRNAHKMSTFNLSLNNVCIEFLIDSGASCNIITAVDYEKVKHFVVLRESNKLLYPYGVKTPMKVRAEPPSKKVCLDANFIVVEKNDVIDSNLLGVDTAISLNMLKIGEDVNQINTSNADDKYSNLKLRYSLNLAFQVSENCLILN